MRSKPSRFHAPVLVLILLLLLGGCAPSNQPTSSEVIVFAAASLTDAMSEIARSFEAAHPGTTVALNFGSSSQLAAQLVEGAPADMFASANPTQMGVVVDSGRVDGEPELFATNRLTAIVPADNPAGIESLGDLAQPGIALVLAVPGVPVRDYTDEALGRLAADPAYGPAFADGFYANLASEEDTVRLVAAKVALGEADAGVVYTSDVTPDIARADDKCEFGKWLHSASLAPETRNSPHYQAIRQLHAEFHQCAGEVLGHALSDRTDQANALLADNFSKKSHTLMVELTRWKQDLTPQQVA